MTNGDRWMVFGLFSVAAAAGIAALVVYKVEMSAPPQLPSVHMAQETPRAFPSPVPYVTPSAIPSPSQQSEPAPAPELPGVKKEDRYPVSIDIDMHREPAARTHAPKKRRSASREKRLHRDWDRARTNFPLLFNLKG